MKRQIHAVRGHERGDGRRPRREARARRHPRDRVLRADAAAHLRRPAAAPARRAHASRCWRELHREGWVGDDAVDELSRAYLFSARGRASPADDRTTNRPSACRSRQTALAPLRPVLRLCRPARLRARSHAASARGRETLRAAVRGRAEARRSRRQPRLHRRRRRSRHAGDAARGSASSGRNRRPRRFAAGTSAAAPPCAAPARARC